MINNIIHFIFGLREQTEEFLFCYYLSVYSAYLVNKPEKIYFYYHFKPYGRWWDELTKLNIVTLKKVSLPDYIGNKKIKKCAHKADKLRMDILFEYGGVYMDIDTISIRPYKHLLKKNVVLGKEISADGCGDRICNAIMMTTPKSHFFKIWIDSYASEFNPNGWAESSLFLPMKLTKSHPSLAHVVSPSVFFLPGWNETEKIFEKKNDIPENLLTLHLWETTSYKFLRNIDGWDWCYKNSHTLYGKIMLHLLVKYRL